MASQDLTEVLEQIFLNSATALLRVSDSNRIYDLLDSAVSKQQPKVPLPGRTPTAPSATPLAETPVTTSAKSRAHPATQPKMSLENQFDMYYNAGRDGGSSVSTVETPTHPPPSKRKREPVLYSSESEPEVTKPRPTKITKKPAKPEKQRPIPTAQDPPPTPKPSTRSQTGRARRTSEVEVADIIKIGTNKFP